MNTEEKRMEQQDSMETPEPHPTNPETNPNASPITSIAQENTNSENPTQKKKMDKRTIIEIIAGVIVLFALIISMGGPSQEQYDDLQKQYNDLTDEFEATNTSLENITNEYSVYKNKMSKFDNLTDEEIEALLAKVDEIVADKKAKEEEAAKAAAEAAEAEAAKQQALNSATISQKNALSKAKDYLAFTAFSYTGLIKQLEYEGFSTEDSTYGADNCGADWNEQAAKQAQNYLDFSSFSRQGLIDQLMYEGFTAEQAEYGVSAVGY